ncbi:Cerebral Cavernous Malformations 2 Protein-Like [Manis pentadactyla]|nr:Cerebral Cavernous Malformations 2 Protein-Like [Manis pentadactyla]
MRTSQDGTASQRLSSPLLIQTLRFRDACRGPACATKQQHSEGKLPEMPLLPKLKLMPPQLVMCQRVIFDSTPKPFIHISLSVPKTKQNKQPNTSTV